MQKPAATLARYRHLFIACLVFAAIVAVLAALAMLRSGGEGNYGVSKAVPLVLLLCFGAAFGLIWFPVNLWTYRRKQVTEVRPGSLEIVQLSGILFGIVILSVAGLLVIFGVEWIGSFLQTPPERIQQLNYTE